MCLLEKIQYKFAPYTRLYYFQIMWVDVAFFNLLEGLAPFGVDVSEVLEKFPKVKILQEKVQANEKIAQWISKRPATES